MQAPVSPLRRASVLGGLLLMAAACSPGALSGGAATQATVEVGGAPLAVAGPPGFCLDPGSTRVDAEGAFVLLTDCGLLTEGAAARRPIGAVLTASLSAADGGAAVGPIADVGRLAGSLQGRALLGHSGDGRQVRVLATRRQEGAVFLLVEDRGPQPLAGIEPRFWRGFVDLDGRLGVVSVLAFQGGEVDAQEGLNLAAGFAGALRRANGL